MKKQKKGYAVALAIAILLSAAGAGMASTVSASTGNFKDPMGNLVNLIAERFNLSTTDVQKVFDEQRTLMEAERKQKSTDRLKQAVTDGKLTQEQANKITAKQAELETAHAALKDKTEAERQAAMKTEMESLKTWITENNIPKEFMMFGRPGMGKGHGKGFGIGGERKASKTTNATATTVSNN